MESFLMIKYHQTDDITKGKFILDVDEKCFHTTKLQHVEPVVLWSPPPVGWHKLNTDGSYGPGGHGGAGMIVRDHNGKIILSSCRQLLSCRDALGTELSALQEGLSLALHWSNLPLIIEIDCLEIVKILKNKEIDRSTYTMEIEEIKNLLKVRQTCITHVKRCQNDSSHFLANYARTNSQTAVLFASGTLPFENLFYHDFYLSLQS
jgi:hypothetical protein